MPEHPFGQMCALGGIEHGREPLLRFREWLDRNDDAERHESTEEVESLVALQLAREAIASRKRAALASGSVGRSRTLPSGFTLDASTPALASTSPRTSSTTITPARTRRTSRDSHRMISTSRASFSAMRAISFAR